MVLGLGLLLAMYNNCGQPRIKPYSGDSQITKDDFYQLNPNEDGEVNKVIVTPYELTVVLEGSTSPIICNWNQLEEKGIYSLEQLGGISGLLIVISDNECKLTPRVPSAPEAKTADHEVCFFIDSNKQICPVFQSEALTNDDRIQIAIGASLRQVRLFDSQNN